MDTVLTEANVEEAGRRLLAFKDFDVNLFDAVVKTFFATGTPKKVQSTCHHILHQFSEHPDSWQLVSDVLTKSQNTQSKVLVLNLLTKCIRQRWRVLPDNQKRGMKNFLEEQIIKLSAVESNDSQHQTLLTKFNSTLIELLKKEWPHNWPTFISDLVKCSAQDMNICCNTMRILQLMSEDICGIDELKENNTMTKEKAIELKKSLQSEFQILFKLCLMVLDKCNHDKLLRQTLVTLSRFITWMPLAYIFETKLLEIITIKYYPTAFQEPAFNCLTEIASIDLSAEQAENKRKWEGMVLEMCKKVQEFTAKVLDPSRSFKQHLNEANSVTFFRQYACFLNALVKSHLSLLESSDESKAMLMSALRTSVKITELDEPELFKITLDMWRALVLDLKKKQRVPNMLGGKFEQDTVDRRFESYRPLFQELRQILISKMVRPKEVLIVENENGEIVYQELKDTVHMMIYKMLKDTLFTLTALDPHGTRNQIISLLESHMDPNQWSARELNVVCWSIGAVSGAMSEVLDKSFVVHVIKLLLSLCELKRGKERKAIIASNIMYVVRKYPRFLRNHWKFLKTVMNKLIEFMSEKFPGVQEMAVDAFYDIMMNCRGRFVKVQDGEPEAYLVTIIKILPEITPKLHDNQHYLFYEALGMAIPAEWNPESKQRLLFALMELTNQRWVEIMRALESQNGDQMRIKMCLDEQFCKQLKMCLTINTRVSKAVKDSFVTQFGKIFKEMMVVYDLYSKIAQKAIVEQGPNAKSRIEIKRCLLIKATILKLLDTTTRAAAESSRWKEFFQSFGMGILNGILGIYTEGPKECRNSMVVGISIVLIKKLGGDNQSTPYGVQGNNEAHEIVRKIFIATFDPTLAMIRANFEDHSELRIKFFEFLQALNKDCFPVIMGLDQAKTEELLQTIAWATKHLEKNVSELGLTTIYEMICNVEDSPNRNEFFKKYLMDFLQQVFTVLTDKLHTSSLNQQSAILQKIFQVVSSGTITVPLWNQGENFSNNQQFICQKVKTMLQSHYKNLTSEVVEKFIQKLVTACRDNEQFRTALRDFLVFSQEIHLPTNQT